TRRDNDGSTVEDRHNLTALCRTLQTSGRPLIANEASALPRRGDLPAGHPSLRSFLGLPLFKGERLVGIVGLANRPGGYDETLVAYLEPFLNTCAGIIDAYHSEQRLQQAEAEIRE